MIRIQICKIDAPMEIISLKKQITLFRKMFLPKSSYI